MPRKPATRRRRQFVRSQHSRGVHDAGRNALIDAALADMLARRRPGQTFTCVEIAKATGMSHGGVSYIVRHALLKLRRVPRVRHLLAEAMDNPKYEYAI